MFCSMLIVEEIMKNKHPKVKIHLNVWGNWYGYLGNKKVIAFSNHPEYSMEQAAIEWKEKMEKEFHDNEQQQS